MLFYCISGCKRSFYVDAVEQLCYDSNLIIDDVPHFFPLFRLDASFEFLWAGWFFCFERC
jgi:hypothetical protein